MAIIKSEIVFLRKDVNRLLDILLDNPEYSLISRTQTLELKNEQIARDLAESKDRAWQIKFALFSSLAGIVASVFVIILQIYINHKLG